MKLENATYQIDSGGYPFLQVFVDGRPARIHYEQKFLHLDIVFLGAEWEELTEPIEIEADKKRDRGAITVRGFVKDARLAQMARDMRAADREGTFKPGTVEIPRGS